MMRRLMMTRDVRVAGMRRSDRRLGDSEGMMADKVGWVRLYKSE